MASPEVTLASPEVKLALPEVTLASPEVTLASAGGHIGVGCSSNWCQPEVKINCWKCFQSKQEELIGLGYPAAKSA